MRPATGQEPSRTQIRTTAAGVVTTLDIAYDGDAPAQEKTNAVVSRTYVTDESGRIVRFCDPDCTAGNPVYTVAWNAHGDAVSVSRIDPATGAATPANRYAYLTWGTPATTVLAGFSDLRFRYLYVGAADVQWDDTIGQGLLYMHARTYSPTVGRFLQPDPARADANLYAYAGNSPVTRVDTSGTQPDAWARGALLFMVWREYSWIDHIVRGFVAPTIGAWVVTTGPLGWVKAIAFAFGWFVGDSVRRDKVEVGDRRRAFVYYRDDLRRVTVVFDIRRATSSHVIKLGFMIFRGGRGCARDIAHGLHDSWNDDFLRSCRRP